MSVMHEWDCCKHCSFLLSQDFMADTIECSLEVKFACRCDDLDIVYILWTTMGAFDEASPLETCTADGPSNVLHSS